MNEQEVLEGIQSSSPKIVLNSLISLADFLDRDSINSQFLNTSYHLLIPLISSNHFKIRSNSLIILSDILENWYDSISDGYLALPGSLLALLSVNKIVSKCGISCLKQILYKENPNVYWTDIEKTITSSRSLEVRIQVLELLTAVSDKIPLIPIVQLVDDPKYQIRRAALELLQTTDMKKLKEAARSVKISYEAMKLLFSTCPELGDIDSLDPNYDKEPFTSNELSFRSKNRTNQDSNNSSQNQQPVMLQSSKLLKSNTNQNSKPLFASTRQYKSRIPTSSSRFRSQQNEAEKQANSNQPKAITSEYYQKNRNSTKPKPNNATNASRTMNKNNNSNYNYNYRNNDDMEGIGIVIRNTKDDLLNRGRTMPQDVQNLNFDAQDQNKNENLQHQDKISDTSNNQQKVYSPQDFFIEEEEEIDIEINIDTNKTSQNQDVQIEINGNNVKSNLVSAQTSPLLPPKSNNNNEEEENDENISENKKFHTNKKMKVTTQSSPTVFERMAKSSAGNSPMPQDEDENDSGAGNPNHKSKNKKTLKQKSANNSDKKAKLPTNGEVIDSPNSDNDSYCSPKAGSPQSPDQIGPTTSLSTGVKQKSAKRSPTGNNGNNTSRTSAKQSPSNINGGDNSSKISNKQSPPLNSSRISNKKSPSSSNNSNNSASRVSAKSKLKQHQLLYKNNNFGEDDQNQHNFKNNCDDFYEEENINENYVNSSNNLLQKKMNHSMKRGAPKTVSFSEPVGQLESAPKLTVSYRPEDLAETTWLEKITFLDSMSSFLSANQQFTDSPLDLLDCVLITAFPPHQKVTFMIPPILSELILRNPEIVRNRLTELVTFSLFTMIGDEWQNDSGFDKFLSVFILESDPTDLIETALKVSDETERKLPFELLIMCVYEEVQDMKLPYSVVSHLVCSLLKRFPLNESQEELFIFICERELEFVRRYGMKLPLDARHKIVSFIRKSEKLNSTENQPVALQLKQKQLKNQHHQKNEISIPNNEAQIMKIINCEFKLGAKKSNLKKCLLALTALEGEISLELFVNFLNYIGKFTETAIYEDEEELSKLCMKHFTSNKFLKFLDANYVLPETVVGFSKIVWCSPQGLLQDADNYLLTLYDIFKNSSGKVRIDIIKIVIAINKVTGLSILDFDEVVEPYRKLITSLITQFHYQK